MLGRQVGVCEVIPCSDTDVEVFLANVFVEEWDEDGVGGAAPCVVVGDVQDPEIVDQEDKAGVDCCSWGGVLGHRSSGFRG